MKSIKGITMSNKERLFYVFIIILQFVFVMVVVKHSVFKKQQRFFTGNNLSGKCAALYSFNAESKDGKKTILFTAYNSDWYLFLAVSRGCGHCEKLLSFFNDSLKDFPFYKEKDLKVFVISVDDFQDEYPNLSFLKVNFDDFFQFGDVYPTIILTNGKGRILLRAEGFNDSKFFKENLIKAIYDAYKKDKYKKSETIK